MIGDKNDTLLMGRWNGIQKCEISLVNLNISENEFDPYISNKPGIIMAKYSPFGEHANAIISLT